MRDGVHDYATLQRQMHEALAAQHPEWIEADGGSPRLEFYDARFAKILTMLLPPAERPSAELLVSGRNVSLVVGGAPRGKTPGVRRIKRT